MYPLIAEKEKAEAVPAPRGSASVVAEHESKRRHFRVLDGIRGLAIIGVLLTHASFAVHNRVAARLLSLGWTGVDLFFVLSGFLITGILLDTRTAINRGRSFYARRALRIFPIYYLTLGLVVIAQAHWGWIAAVAEMPTLASRIPYVFYFVNFAPLWHHGNAHQTMLEHFWSLAVEEQFYFVWPVIVWHLSTRAVYKLCGVALGCALLLRVYLGTRYGYGPWIFMLPMTRADGLFVGSAVAALLASNYRPSKRLLAAVAMTAASGLAVIVALGHVQIYYGGPLMCTFGFTSLAMLFGILIAYTIRYHDALLSRALRARWLCNLGRYSYGMYVYHLPLYYLFEHLAKDRLGMKFPLRGAYAGAYLGVLIAATYGSAWVSFHCFEERFLRLKHRFVARFGGTERPAESLPFPDHRQPVAADAV